MLKLLAIGSASSPGHQFNTQNILVYFLWGKEKAILERHWQRDLGFQHFIKHTMTPQGQQLGLVWGAEPVLGRKAASLVSSLFSPSRPQGSGVVPGTTQTCVITARTPG